MPARVGLRLPEWPAADRAAWTKANGPFDFFAADAHAAHWREKTRYQASSAYGRWLAYLAQTSPAALREEPAERATSERLASYFAVVGQRIAAMSVVAEINHLRLALRAIAPGTDLDWLAQLQHRWARLAQPRERRGKMVDARRLFALGVTLMTAAKAASDTRAAARDYRDGLLLALLVSRPLRRKNLAELEIGVHLLAVGDGFLVSISADSTKSGQPLEFEVPEDLVPYLAHYLSDVRTRFPNAHRHAGLWPSSKGARLGADAIYDLVCRRTRAAFGHEISPHLFRSIAATTLVRDAPAQSLMASDLLGHAAPATTDQYYTRARTLAASRRYGELIARLCRHERH